MPNDKFFMTRRNVNFAIGFKNIIFETNINNKTQKDG